MQLESIFSNEQGWESALKFTTGKGTIFGIYDDIGTITKLCQAVVITLSDYTASAIMPSSVKDRFHSFLTYNLELVDANANKGTIFLATKVKVDLTVGYRGKDVWGIDLTTKGSIGGFKSRTLRARLNMNAPPPTIWRAPSSPHFRTPTEGKVIEHFTNLKESNATSVVVTKDMLSDWFGKEMIIGSAEASAALLRLSFSIFTGLNFSYDLDGEGVFGTNAAVFRLVQILDNMMNKPRLNKELKTFGDLPTNFSMTVLVLPYTSDITVTCQNEYDQLTAIFKGAKRDEH